MKSGYHQVELLEQHKERTAFTVGPLGFFEFNRLAFGLVNAPATYQRLMEECLGELHTTICYIYLDDLIIFSKTYEEHIERLEMVFQRLREYNLKLSPKKCSFLQRRVKYVGHIVSENGVEADPEKIDKVVNWPTPSTPEDVRKFLGFAGYYRKYVKDFAKVAKPLTELMPAPTHSKRNKGKKTKPVDWKWGPDQEQAFQKIKEHLSSPPILGFANYELPFELHTDASCDGLGAVLYQRQDGHLRVIAYASRGLSRAERNYSAHKLEFLALKWSVCEKFNDYLYGSRFTVLTDNNPLTYILTSAKLDATGHRWLASLAAYDFDIKYRPGKTNMDADIMSRLPSTAATSESEKNELLASLPVATATNHITTDGVQAVCDSVYAPPYIECLSFSTQVVDQCDDQHSQSLHQFTDEDWRQAQWKDPVLRPWIGFVRENKRPTKGEIPVSPTHSTLMRTFDHLRLDRGILHREISIDGEKQLQVVLPHSLVPKVLQGLHNDIGHPGRDRTLSLLRDRFYWPGMQKDADQWIQSCDRCLRRKSPTNTRAPLINIKTSQPLELVCMDFLSLETSKGGFEHILIITDHFTRYAQAIPTKNQTAKTTAEAFFNNFVIHYGFPKRIHSDQGANFQSKLLQELCNICNIDKSRTTPYHPCGNGMCERFNRTLLNMLGTLEQHKKVDWKSHVGPLVHAYNCTRHDSTGQAPFFLMFGRQPRLPIDLAFGIDLNKNMPQSKYATLLRERLAKSYELASEASRAAQDKQKRGYDIKVRGAGLQKGDRVLVKALAFEGKHKIADKWEEEVYVILDHPNAEIPVFVVQQENGVGRKRTLHRNHLLPIGCLPPSTETAPTPAPRRPPIPTPRRRTRASGSPSINTDDTSSVVSDSSSVIDPLVIHTTVNDKPEFVNVPTVDTEVIPTPQYTGDDHVAEDVVVSDSDGDAHPSQTEEEESVDQDNLSRQEDVSSEEDVLESDPENDSETVDDMSQDADAAVDTDQEQPTDDNQPRRSSRVSRKPDWMLSGQYAMSAQQHNTDWERRVSCLRDIISSGCLGPSSQDKAVSAMLDLVTGHKK